MGSLQLHQSSKYNDFIKKFNNQSIVDKNKHTFINNRFGLCIKIIFTFLFVHVTLMKKRNIDYIKWILVNT